MAEYYYDADDEVFKRTDRKGNHLAINIVEAHRIIQMIDMGVSKYKINREIEPTNPKAGSSTVNSFIKNYEKGNIIMPENAPAPVQVFKSITESDRLDSMEERIEKLERDLEEFERRYLTPKNKGLSDKVKSWIR